MANPQPTDSHLRIAHSITEAIMLRDFSKRQRKILDLILRLSWGCGKKSAFIPHQKDFCVVGLYEADIKKEITWLVQSKIITREENTYSFNKDFDQWQISRVFPFEPDKLSELLSINLNGHQELSKTLSAENKNLVKSKEKTKCYTKFSTSKLATPIESIIEKTNVYIEERDSNKHMFNVEHKPMSQSLSLKDFDFLDENEVEQAIKDYSMEWVQGAVDQARAKKRLTWGYVMGILQNCAREGHSPVKTKRHGKIKTCPECKQPINTCLKLGQCGRCPECGEIECICEVNDEDRLSQV